MQGDRWYCNKCKKIFYEPAGFTRQSRSGKFEMRCPFCYGFKTENGELLLMQFEKEKSRNTRYKTYGLKTKVKRINQKRQKNLVEAEGILY